MPRIGQNPMKWVQEIHHPERITCTTIVYIPFLDGYWRESLDVLKLCLQSMRQSTQLPFDLMIFDNGSCSDVQDYLIDLRRKGEIQFLILSDHNIGKVGGWNVLFAAAPGEIVSYCDSDVYFLTGWLKASLEVLETFPEAGIVTAQPVCGPLSQRNERTLKAARICQTVSIKEYANLVPQKYVDAVRVGLGETKEKYSERIRGRKDVLLTRGTVQAYVSASHFQFVTTKKVLRKISEMRAKRPIGDVDQFDAALDQVGLWRLSTKEYLVHHMGNRVPDLHEEIPWLFDGFSGFLAQEKLTNSGFRYWLLGNNMVRRFLKRINVLSYELLYKRI